MDLVFPFAEFWWLYAAFAMFVLLLLALDLGVFHRHPHAVSFRESLGWSVVWAALALAFNYGFFVYASGRVGAEIGERLALEFLTGYVVEKSLAIDNVFVFVLVFAYFGIPLQYQHRVLFYGIIGALVFRAIFIALGSVLMQYTAVVMVFGAFLIVTGIKMLRAPEHKVDPERNALIPGWNSATGSPPRSSTRTTPSSPAVASVVPAGAASRAKISPPSTRNVPRARPSAASQHVISPPR